MTAAEYLGYRIDHKPITISDVDQWQEVFVTSPLKIITPTKNSNNQPYYYYNDSFTTNLVYSVPV
jgi:branched-subunit amino acid aminotransferase/4-amino-4-deoxychorismate lyase